MVDGGEAKVGFVDEGGGGEGVAGSFAAEEGAGDAAEFVVDEREKLFARLFIAFAEAEEKLGDGLHGP